MGDNWAHPSLDGVWKQARAVRLVLKMCDPKLCRKLDAFDRVGTRGRDDVLKAQPLAFLFAPIFLRLKREMFNLQEAMRLWEVCWAHGRHFHVLVLAAFVRAERRFILGLADDQQFECHQHFGKLHETLRAEPLLVAARQLHARAKITQALEETLGVMEKARIV